MNGLSCCVSLYCCENDVLELFGHTAISSYTAIL